MIELLLCWVGNIGEVFEVKRTDMPHVEEKALVYQWFYHNKTNGKLFPLDFKSTNGNELREFSQGELVMDFDDNKADFIVNTESSLDINHGRYELLRPISQDLSSDLEKLVTSFFQLRDQNRNFVYKILTRELWQQSTNEKKLKLTSFDNDFIHLAEIHQIKKVVEKFFFSQQKTDLILVQLDPQKLQGKLVHETNPGGEQKYYHLYKGSLPVKAIEKTYSLDPDNLDSVIRTLNSPVLRKTVSYEDYSNIGIHSGTIIHCENNHKANKPAYKIWADFGSQIGVKQTSAQVTDHYHLKDLLGMKILGVINFPSKNIAGFTSEFLLLGLSDGKDAIRLTTIHDSIANGSRLH